MLYVLIGSAFTALFAFLLDIGKFFVSETARFLIKRTIIITAAIVAFSAATKLFLDVVFSYVSQYFNLSLDAQTMQLVSMFIPTFLPTAMSVWFSCFVAAFVYKTALMVLNWKVSS